MSAVLLSIIALVVAAFIILTSRLFYALRRSGVHDNWKNEAYLASEEAGAWAESEYAVGKDNDVPSSIFPGVR